LDVDPQSGARVGDAQRLTSGLNLAEFTPSPDGRKILAVKAKDQSRLWSFPTGPGPYTTLTAGMALTGEGFEDAEPEWTADGKGLVFISNRRGPIDIWKLTPGGAPVQLTTGDGDKSMPKPSPDGRWLAFFRRDQNGSQARVMRPDGGDEHFPLLAGDERYPFSDLEGWSPDGGRAAVTLASKAEPYTTRIVTVDRETGTVRDPATLNVPGAMAERFVWSPDGRFLVYKAVGDGSWDLWVTDPEGKSPRRLTSDPGNERVAKWSPDGKYLYYVKDYRSVWRLPMDSDARPTGPAELWAVFPKTRINGDGLAVSKQQIVVAVTEEASDLWLVEFRGEVRIDPIPAASASERA
jgi:Tol biopolymer transport system component